MAKSCSSATIDSGERALAQFLDQPEPGDRLAGPGTLSHSATAAGRGYRGGLEQFVDLDDFLERVGEIGKSRLEFCRFGDSPASSRRLNSS